MKKRRGNGMLESFMKSKKAAEMTIGTIIIIILALVVLVVIIYGFTTGWSNLWQKIVGFGGGKEDVYTHVQACQLACTTNSKFDYCRYRNITFENNVKRTLRCIDLAADPKYGLEACANINCEEINDGSCTGFKGRWQKDPCSTKQITIPLGLITNSADRGDNEYCCKTTCSSLGGIWSNSACVSGYVNRYDELSDRDEGKDATTVGATNCCVAR